VKLLAGTPASIDEAVELLREGSLVAIPTDTVYGLAARLDEDAPIQRLFAAKDRPASLPVAALCASTEDARALAASWPASATTLAARYWPGPLTLVVDAAPELVTRLGSRRGVGLRVPSDTLCRALLVRTGPLAVTSANPHGAAPVTTADGVLAILDGVAAVLDGGTRDGAVSTVVDLTGPSPVVVREGAIPWPELLDALSQG
jgi:L-threonylcarbamoyladenylate synthase